MRAKRIFQTILLVCALFSANHSIAWDLSRFSIRVEIGGPKKNAEPLDCVGTLKKWCNKITSTAQSSGDGCLAAAESGKTLKVFFNCGFITAIRLGIHKRKARSQCQRACKNECNGGLKKLCEVSNS